MIAFFYKEERTYYKEVCSNYKVEGTYYKVPGSFYKVHKKDTFSASLTSKKRTRSTTKSSHSIKNPSALSAASALSNT